VNEALPWTARSPGFGIRVSETTALVLVVPVEVV
jgi:hypothetical protein